MIEFNGQAVIVTGAGRGLGRLYALDLAQRGASVLVNDAGVTMHGEGADPSVADQVVAEIAGLEVSRSASYDSVASEEGGAAIVQQAIEEFGRLDAVVSNAGIFDTVPFDELPAENWRQMLNVHLNGGFYLSQPAYRIMKAQGGGRFVFIASSAGLFGQPNSAHYAAAKAGLVGLANVISIDGAPARHLGEHRPTVRLLPNGDRDCGRPRRAWRRCAVPPLHRARARGAHGRLSRQPNVHLHAPELLSLCRSLRSGLRGPGRGLGRVLRHAAHGGSDRSPSGRGGGHGAVHRPGIHLR